MILQRNFIVYFIVYFLVELASHWINAICPGELNTCSLRGECIRDPKGDYCDCEWGWTKNDCTEKMCPYGRDITSRNDKERIIGLSVKSDEGRLQGMLHLSFHNHIVEMPANGETMGSDECTRVFQLFQNIEEATCKRVSIDRTTGSSEYQVVLKRFPTFPIMNNLYVHNGNPAISEFSCNTDHVTNAIAVRCEFYDIQESNIGYYSCSNHGRCNKLGRCDCENGYYGDNCENNSDNGNMLYGISQGPFFSGNLLSLVAFRSFSSEFSIISASVGSEPVFTIDGNGETKFWHGSVEVKKGDIVLRDGFLYVNKGGARFDSASVFELNDSPLYISRKSSDSNNNSPLLSLVSSVQSTVTGIFIAGQMSDGATASAIDILNNNEKVYDMDYHGNINLYKGSMTINGDGGLTTKTLSVREGQSLDGGLNITSNGLLITSGGISSSGDIVADDCWLKIFSPKKDEPSLSIMRETAQNSPPALDVYLRGSGGSFVSLKRDDIANFEVDADGKVIIYKGGAEVKAGGLDVISGGLRIRSGGVEIEEGGLKIVKGGLKLLNDGFTIEDGGFEVITHASSSEALKIVSDSSMFSGSSLLIDILHETSHSSNFIHMRRQGDTISLISSDGDAQFKSVSADNLVSKDGLMAKRIFLQPFFVEANDEIDIPQLASYVHVRSNNQKSLNKIRLPSAKSGEILIIANDDEDSIESSSGETDIIVLPHSVSIFIHNDLRWNPITVTSFDTRYLNNIEQISAVKDINIGEVRFTASELQAGKCPSKHVSIYGDGGVLTYDNSLTFDTSDSTLKVQNLEVSSLKGTIYAENSMLWGPIIQGGKLNDVHINAIDAHISKELYVESDGFIGGSLSVHGTVMGSGAYVDTSDERFKKNIFPIQDSSDILSKLEGVTFEYKHYKFRKYNLPKRRSLGFIAQQVEKVLPSIIHKDNNGYRYVAYSQVIPILVEGWKTHEIKMKKLESESKTSLKSVKVLKETIAACQKNMAKQENEIKKLKEFIRIEEKRHSDLVGDLMEKMNQLEAKLNSLM